jgi:hypothetical protein
MKQILMALAITAFACSGVQAQTCKAKTAYKHKSTLHRTTAYNLPKRETTTSSSECRVVPYMACSILPDRRFVSCYQTTDLDNLTPMNNEKTVYGPTGAVPGEPRQFSLPTKVIKGERTPDYCKRNTADNATVCYSSGPRLFRDENGFYGYR